MPAHGVKLLLQGMLHRETYHNVNWNVFRYFGDIFHLIGIILLVGSILHSGSFRGVSIKTVALYLAIFTFRYALSLFRPFEYYLIFFKFFFISSHVYLIHRFLYDQRSTHEQCKDSANLIILLIPCLVITPFLTSDIHSVSETLWTLSEIMEGIAMIPQYVFFYRSGTFGSVPTGVLGFVIFVGLYRILYTFNWVYKRASLGNGYNDWTSWIGGGIEIIFFLDFVSFLIFQFSILKVFILKINEKLNEIELIRFTKKSEIDDPRLVLDSL